jgi:hypothetical protein
VWYSHLYLFPQLEKYRSSTQSLKIAVVKYVRYPPPQPGTFEAATKLSIKADGRPLVHIVLRMAHARLYPYKMEVNFNVLGPLMLNWIYKHIRGIHIVTKHYRLHNAEHDPIQ